MKANTLNRLEKIFSNSPIMRADDVPTESEVDAASAKLGIKFSDDFREFLLLYGSATVGAFPVFGLRPSEIMYDHWSVIEVTLEIWKIGINGVESLVIVSEDHAGNPIGMDSAGKIWIYDHDFGGVSELAQTFEEYLRLHCLKLSK